MTEIASSQYDYAELEQQLLTTLGISMDEESKAGRSVPCPWGSGRKYGKCFGATSHSRIEGNESIEFFRLNREIAYKGKIGRQREEFCVGYIRYKQERFGEIRSEPIKQATARGETVTCQEGCSYCCVLYVEAYLQECEAIICHLYHNERALYGFLRKYPHWRARIRRNADLVRRCKQNALGTLVCGFTMAGQQASQAYEEAGKHYALQNICCPFLNNRICSIYDVRPWMCAAYYATTPSEWCNLANRKAAKLYRTVPTESMSNVFFYYKPPSAPALTFMPVAVYEILKGGFMALSRTPGSESLEEEAMSDPEVRAVFYRFL